MPMLDIQRRHAEVFRIRLGEKDANNKPRKLSDAMRLTSPSRSVVEAFVDTYGGKVVAWDAPDGGQWEAKLPITEMSIMVLPGQSITQWWELYRSSVCDRRCDGYTETISGKPCMCPPDIAVRIETSGACRPMTRVNVLCPDVDVVGAGGLVTHGLVAAETLPQSIAIAEAALARGLMVPAVLRVVEHKGKRHFVVPQIEITGVNLHALATGEVKEVAPAPPRAVASAPQAALAAAPAPKPTKPKAPKPTPTTTAPPPLPHEMAEPIDEAFDVGPIRTEIASHDAEIREAIAEGWKWGSVKEGTHKPIAKADCEAALAHVRAVAAAIYDRRRKRALAELGEAGVKSTEARHRLVSDATGGATDSTKRLTPEQLIAIVTAAVAIAEAPFEEASA